MGNWLPKSVLSLKSYTKRMFVSDLLAGITVGLVALPLAMAFAIASGVPPQAGLYCAIVAGFTISALGGSSTQIGGPTGAFVVVVFGIVAKYGIDGLFMCTLLAGVLLLILGATGLGTAVKFIPRPVVVGFTNGIAVIIASTQIKDFFGLKIDKVPGEFAPRILAFAHNFSSFSPLETTLAASALALIILFMIFVKKVPGYIVALFVGTAAVVIFKLPVETIGTRFGGIPSGFPVLKVPHLPGPAAASDLTGNYGRHVRRNRITDVRAGLRSHERGQAQPKCGARRAGSRQHYLPSIRGTPSHWSDRSNGHQYSLRRQDTGRWHGPRADSSRHCPFCRTACPVYSIVGPRGHSPGGFLQHGRVGRDSGTFETVETRD